MTTLSKERVISLIDQISKMGVDELSDFREKISLSDIDDKARSFLNRAVDERIAKLEQRDGAFLEGGEIDDILGNI